METPEALRKMAAQNRKARFEYFIEETYEAGIMLAGSEIKSVRLGKASIIDAHAGEINGELYLLNANIPEYSNATMFSHEPKRPRKLLLHKKEIKKLLGKIRTKGLTLVALSIYFNEKKRAKVELALARGKKLHDKRDTDKNRDWDREKGRVMRDKGVKE
jgi:SsrA-binding protein